MADTHTVMPKKLAQALMEASMQHFAAGGPVNTNTASGFGNSAVVNPLGAASSSGMLGGSNSAANQVLNNPFGQAVLNPLGSILGTAQDNFQAQTAGDTSGQVLQQYGNQQQVYGQQQALAQQLLAQSQGQGPGQNLVAQQGANNIAGQSAAMASARGASANPAAIARQAAIQGQQGQQQVLNAQNQATLQGQQALGQEYGQMANESLQGQSIGQGAIAAANTANAGVAAQNSKTNGGILGGVASAVSSILNQGGEVKKMADGGYVDTPQQPMGIAQYGSPQGTADLSSSGDSSSGGAVAGIIGSLAALLACGGTVPNPNQMLAGGNVPGQASVKGNSPKNDTVPTMLSPGEDVIPRSISQLPEKEMEQKAVEFLKHIHKKHTGGYQAVAESRKKRA